EGDHVGFEAKHLAGSKDMAEAAEGGNHLVRDVEYVVFPADFADTLQIAIRRDDDPARRLDRLADKGANALRTDSLHGLPKLRHEKIGKTFPAHALGAPERIGRGELDNKIVRAVHPVAVARAAIERGGKIGGTMIGAAARQDQLFLRTAACIVVELHEAQRRFYRRGAASGVEDV